jgi:hypothetical protein
MRMQRSILTAAALLLIAGCGPQGGNSGAGHERPGGPEGASPSAAPPPPIAPSQPLVPESEQQAFSSRHGVSLKHPRAWRASDDSEKLALIFPADKFAKQSAGAGASRPWGEHASLDEWKARCNESNPLYATIVLGSSTKNVQRRIDSTGTHAVFYWQGQGAPNWLADFDPAVKEFTLHVIEFAEQGEAKVTTTMIWAFYPSDSQKLKEEARFIVQSMSFDDLEALRISLP